MVTLTKKSLFQKKIPLFEPIEYPLAFYGERRIAQSLETEDKEHESSPAERGEKFIVPTFQLTPEMEFELFKETLAPYRDDVNALNIQRDFLATQLASEQEKNDALVWKLTEYEERLGLLDDPEEHEAITQFRDENKELKDQLTIVQGAYDCALQDVRSLRQEITELATYIAGLTDERDFLDSKLERYEERFGLLDDPMPESTPRAQAGPRPPKPTIEEMLRRPREERFAGLTISFTGDLRPYRKGLTRKAASAAIRSMGGKIWPKDHCKGGDYIVCGDDASNAGNLARITVEEFLQLIDS